MDGTRDIQPTPLDEVPLHGFDTGPLQWWACQFPERPADDLISYDGRCRACLIAAEAELALRGDSATSYSAHDHRGTTALSELVAASKAYLDG